MSDTATSAPPRDTIFVSHANPEDNTFALWITLRLAAAGYRVWCDLTNPMGGETFWDDAETAIRDRTAKFCYVLSQTSNAKDGPLRELQLAQAVARQRRLQHFVIPLHVDDLSHADVTIELQRLLTIPFRSSWAKGLSQLLEGLEADAVPRSPSGFADAVASWWRTHADATQGLLPRSEEYVSNLFPLVQLPDTLFFHQLHRDSIGKIEVPTSLPIPASQDGGQLVSFGSADELASHLPPNLSISSSRAMSSAAWLRNGCPGSVAFHLRRILKLSWEAALQARHMPLHDMSNGTRSMYFRAGLAEGDVVGFDWGDGRRGYRQVVGFKTITNLRSQTKSTRYWHYGIDAKAVTQPCIGFAIRSHVFFSDDAQNLWANPDRLHAAFASQCKNWWNDAWRDRLMGTMNWLASGKDSIGLSVGNEGVAAVRATPLSFNSPIAYLDPGEAAWAEDDEIRDHAEEEEAE